MVGKLLRTLLSVSGRKTTKSFAISTMSDLVKNLEEKYDFLKHVEVKNTLFVEDEDPIIVMSDINNINPTDIGPALSTIIFKILLALLKRGFPRLSP